MHRTQLLFEEWQYAALKALAAQEGRSLSAVVREAVDCLLSRKKREAGVLQQILGIAEEGATYARDHDKYLYGGSTEDR